MLFLDNPLLRLAELVARYADRRPDLADLCLIRLSELHGQREAIPLIHPPKITD